MQQIVFGTAGHIDHGKTALVKALTGENTDSLPEEKLRGISIDIGFAYLNERISIIDVPGHEKFIRNMAAGAANIHFALIVVAINDGIMPQTIEHVNILKILGVEECIVALTKIDLAEDEEWIKLIEEDIKQLLSSKKFLIGGIHKVDSISGKGIKELKNSMLSFLNNNTQIRQATRFRMNIDRVFSKTGFGTVVTGTVIGGELSKGDTIELFPQEIHAKVRGLQSHGGVVEKVTFGDRAAINLSNIKEGQVKRGTVLGEPGRFLPTKCIIANIGLVDNIDWKLKKNQRLRFHFGTQEVLGRILIPNANTNIQDSNSLNIIIVLESKVSVLLDEKFLIRSYSPIDTIGGGFVLERIFNYKWKKISKRAVQMPKDSQERFYYLVNQDWGKPLTLQQWREAFQVNYTKIISWISNKLIHDKKTDYVFSFDNVKKSKAKLKTTFDYFYSKNAFRKVLSIHLFIKKLNWSENWLTHIINQLVDENIITRGEGGYSLSDYEIKLNSREEKEVSKIRSIIKNLQNKPFLLKDIISKLDINPKRTADLLFLLQDMGEIEFVGEDFWLDKIGLDNIISDIKLHFKSKDLLTINDFKSLTGLSRRSAIPLLEYFDRKKITFRNDNVRFQGSELD